MINTNNSVEEIRADTKKSLESFEHWSRRLINDEMSEKYGDDYFDRKLLDGNNLIKKEITDLIYQRMKDSPNERFAD